MTPGQCSHKDINQELSRRHAMMGIASLVSWAGMRSPAWAQERVVITDTHIHIERDRRQPKKFEAVFLLRTMDSFEVPTGILAPPPLPPGRTARYGLNALRMIAGEQKQRLAYMAGRDTPNPIIQETHRNAQTEISYVASPNGRRPSCNQVPWASANSPSNISHQTAAPILTNPRRRIIFCTSPLLISPRNMRCLSKFTWRRCRKIWPFRK